MKRPPSSGQHFWMGRFASVGQASRQVLELFSQRAGRLARRLSSPRMSAAFGHGSVRVGGASKLCTTSLHGPSFTSFGLAWRKSSAWPSSLMASRKLVGGLAFISEPSSAAASSTEFAPRLMAMRLCEPIVLMATGNGDTVPLTVGLLEEQRLAAAGRFHFAVGQFGDFEFGGDGLRDAFEFAGVVELALTKSRKDSKAIRA